MSDSPPPADRPDAADGTPPADSRPDSADSRLDPASGTSPVEQSGAPRDASFPPPVAPGQYASAGQQYQPYGAPAGTPYGNGPYGPQGTAPGSYTGPGDGSTPRRSGLGLAALIVGLVALLLALVPIVNFLAILIALTGVVLAIVALAKKNPGRGLALAGLIVSAVAVILAIVLAVFYTTQIVESIEDADRDFSDIGPTPDIGSGDPLDESDSGDADGDGFADGPQEGDEGSRTNPAPIGTSAEFVDPEGNPEWVVTAGEPVLDATAQVAQDEFNDVAPAGSQFVLVPLTIQYLGEDSGFPYDLTVTFVTEAGNTYESGDVYAAVPPEFDDINELYSGAEATGNVVIAVPSDEVATGSWAVSTLYSDPYFFAAQ